MCIPLPDHRPDCPAAQPDAADRRQLARHALAGVPLAHLAAQHHVSRKFVYQQLHTAQLALDQAFDPPHSPDQLRFWLPVTRPWLQQLVLGLVLICHSSYRGVTELLTDLFDHSLSLGTVHNIVQQAIAPAQTVNQ